MPSIQETAYPRLKTNLTTQELTTIFTPTAEERALADKHTRTRPTYVSFLILLKTFQRLGYAISSRDVPGSIIRHIAVEVGQSVLSQDI